MKKLPGLAPLVILTIFSFPVHAALVSWGFSGTINSVSNYYPTDTITSIGIGDAFSGTMVFENTTPGTLVTIPNNYAMTTYSNAIHSLNFVIGSSSFSGPNVADSVLSPGETSHIKVYQDLSGFTSDAMYYNAGFFGNLDGLSPDFVGLTTFPPYGTDLPSGDLLDTPPSPALNFVIRFRNSEGNITAQMNGSGTIAVVPIPAAVWLFGSALLGLLGLSYRHNKV
ncbi:MAG: hypothetical protein ABW092_08680 [Candidatus Thiodiazotropha sp.]